jgi:hypothetical protein
MFQLEDVIGWMKQWVKLRAHTFLLLMLAISSFKHDSSLIAESLIGRGREVQAIGLISPLVQKPVQPCLQRIC